MLKPQAKLVPGNKPKPAVVVARPSNSYIQIMGPQAEADCLAKELENDLLYNQLCKCGIIHRVILREKIPRHKYNAYLLDRALSIIRHYEMDRHPLWKTVLMNYNDEACMLEFGKDIGIPTAQLLFVLRVFGPNSTMQYRSLPCYDTENIGGVPSNRNLLTESTFDYFSSFVSSYGVSELDFTNYILSGLYNCRQISEHFGCTVDDAQQLVELVNLIQLSDILDEAAGVNDKTSSGADINNDIIAEVHVEDDNSLVVTFGSARISRRYLIDQARLEAWIADADNSKARELVDKLEILNLRMSTLAMVVRTICECQRAFIASGDTCDLSPITAAEVARLVGCHRSVVSRLTRSNFVVTPHGEYELPSLIPGTSRVVCNLVKTHPDWSDSTIAHHLFERFGVQLSRRTINYHRNGLVRSSEDNSNA